MTVVSGFECYNSDGKLQFSTALLTFALKKTGTVTSVTASYQAAIVYGQSAFSVSGVPANAFVAIGGGLGYSSAIDFNNRADGSRFFVTDAPVGTSFDYYIYVVSNNVPAGNFGLEVYMDSGDLVFSTNQRPMISPNIILNSSGGNPFTLSGHKLACCQMTFAGYNRYSDEDDEPDGWYYTQQLSLYGGGISNSNQTVTINEVMYSVGTFGPTPSFPPGYAFEVPGSFIVVDVTGVPVGQTFF